MLLETTVTPTGAVAGNTDPALTALCMVAEHFRIATEPATLARGLALQKRAEADDLIRAAQRLGLKAHFVAKLGTHHLSGLPTPAIALFEDGGCAVVTAVSATIHLIEGPSWAPRELTMEAFIAARPQLVLLQRRTGEPGGDRTAFGFGWFLPSLWRYRKPLADVMLLSLVVQLLALATPLFFEVVVDKVLAHKSYSTLLVLVVGFLIVAAFDVGLQYLRSWLLTHTTNRIDVELGQRLFQHLLALPVGYFETRPAGQTVARMRELETIRSFLTGQGLFAGLDLIFTVIFMAVLFAYSVTLAWIVAVSIPFYLLIGSMVRPLLKTRIDEKFDRGALSQQLLVEAVVGIQTLKAAAVEAPTAVRWEERLAAYVQSSFAATLLALRGQNLIQYVSKATTGLLMLFGARAVIDGELTVGALVAFNMIAGQVAQPILRLSQLWQDLQQVQISIDRLGDILNAVSEPRPQKPMSLPTPKGHIAFEQVSFRYKPTGQDILKEVSLTIQPGEVIGIVGPSGSGKSTLTKLLQRFYAPADGQILLDGQDIAQLDPTWLRSHIGVVLQENLLFNGSLHDNIALAHPTMSRAEVMRVAKLAGADAFISRLPQGYDTLVEERGANLSGGQRQRIAIARALATNPPILILDEATSALDYESERIILANMREIVQGRTVIIIAHRLATVRSCDRIVGMETGRIVEIGSHAELLAHQGIYARLWTLQNGAEDGAFKASQARAGAVMARQS